MTVVARVLAVVLSACLATLPGWAAASPAQPGVVSDNPADYTPNLLSTSSGRKPHVDALAQRGTTLYAGGLFDLVENSARTAT